MKRSRSAASKKRTTAVSRKPTTPKKSRSSAASRRTAKKAVSRTAKKNTAATRTPAKKTTARKPAPKRARAATPTPRAKATPTRRTATKKPATTRVARTPKVAPAAAPVQTVPANELKVGVVTHYYSHLAVAVVSLTDRGLRVGDRIHIKGHTSDFYQPVDSLHIEHESVTASDRGRAVGMKVTDHAREHDTVYVVT